MPDQEWSQQAVEQQAADLEKPETETPQPETQAEEVKEKVVEQVEKVVPIHALHESRAKEREARAQNAQLQQQLRELQRQQQEFMARVNQPQQPAVPSYDEDPLRNMHGNIQQTQKQLQELADQNKRELAAREQQAQMQQFAQAVRSAAADFEAREPGANDGINFWKQSLLKEYEASGLGRQQAVQRVLREEFELAYQAMQVGDNPAEVAFNRAVARGYVPGGKKLEMQKAGQGAALPTASSGKGGGLPSLEALLKMDPKDFSKATSGDNWEKLLRKHG